MRHHWVHLLGVATAIALLVLGIGPRTPVTTTPTTLTSLDQATTNLVSDSGFESGGLTGWTCSSADTVTTSPAHSGSAAAAGTPAGQDFAQCAQTISVQPSSRYTLSAWVQGRVHLPR